MNLDLVIHLVEWEKAQQAVRDFGVRAIDPIEDEKFEGDFFLASIEPHPPLSIVDEFSNNCSVAQMFEAASVCEQIAEHNRSADMENLYSFANYFLMSKPFPGYNEFGTRGSNVLSPQAACASFSIFNEIGFDRLEDDFVNRCKHKPHTCRKYEYMKTILEFKKYLYMYSRLANEACGANMGIVMYCV